MAVHTDRLPHHASFVFKGVDGEALLMALDVEGVSCSTGSACTSGDPEPSPVLVAMGIPRGPIYSKIFSRLHAARLDGEIKTREEEVQIAQQIASAAE